MVLAAVPGAVLADMLADVPGAVPAAAEAAKPRGVSVGTGEMMRTVTVGVIGIGVGF